MTSLGQSAAAWASSSPTSPRSPLRRASPLINLGDAAQQSQPSLVATQPLANRLKTLGDVGAPTAQNLQTLLQSLDTTGGIEQLMKPALQRRDRRQRLQPA